MFIFPLCVFVSYTNTIGPPADISQVFIDTKRPYKRSYLAQAYRSIQKHSPLFRILRNLNKPKQEQVHSRHILSVVIVTDAIKKELVQRIIRNLLDIHILRLVQTRPMWGYMIKKQAEIKFNVRLRHGALYPLLNAMEDKGFLTSERQQQGGRIRKVYSITGKGKEYVDIYSCILKEQIQRQDISQKEAA